ncbi:AIPR family protein [Amylibacter sp.]|nr:AIPR family protein [Amylibacter sp.]
MNDINNFAELLNLDVRNAAEATGLSNEEAFFQRITDTITGSGEVDNLEYFHHRGNSVSGIRVDGWGGDPRHTNQLTLFIIEHSNNIEAPVLTASELNSYFKRPLRFLENALKSEWRDALEETSPGYELAQMIDTFWKHVNKIRLLLLTDRKLSNRVDGREMTEFQEIPVSFSVWDINRLERIEGSALGREDIIVNLEEHGGVLPVLEAHMPMSPYKSYLAALPGRTLASIYDRWQARLLEQNVRVFLQARGNVNKGIKKTLEEDPTMFFAYNNGITATAEAVEIEQKNGINVITKLINLQIVNGGQTSASINNAMQKKVDLTKTFVQMKLSIIDRKDAEKIVPDISKYANSQNKVAAADFESNHPFHIRVEDISRRLYAPVKNGSFSSTKWYYERVRGQFADQRSNEAKPKLKQFDLEHPRTQLFTKTDLGKALMSWEERPELVSHGAQKNFAIFAHQTSKEWKKNSQKFSDEWFQSAIAKLLIFRKTERVISDASSSWYTGGLRAQTVCYTISKLVHDISSRKQAIDLQEIWKRQDISTELTNVIDAYAEAMHNHILSPPAGNGNPSQWAKKKSCAEDAMKIELDFLNNLENQLIGKSEEEYRNKEGKKDQVLVDGLTAIIKAGEIGKDNWLRLQSWLNSSNTKISYSENGILEAATKIHLKPLTEAQAQKILKLLEKAQAEGFKF